MFRKKHNHPTFGPLTRLFGPWHGHITIPGWTEPVELIVEIALKEQLDSLLATLDRCWVDSGTVKAKVAKHLFENYCIFKKMDIEEAGMTEDDFEGFPSVSSPADVYSACTPDKMRIGDSIGVDTGNAYILVDVDWPNGHTLQLFFQIDEAGIEYTHVELVG